MISSPREMRTFDSRCRLSCQVAAAKSWWSTSVSLVFRQSPTVDGPGVPTAVGPERGAAQEVAVNRAVGLIDGSPAAGAWVAEVLLAVHAAAQPDAEGAAGGVAFEGPGAVWCLP